MFNPIQAINAIKARINGEFDNLLLQSLNALSNDTLADIIRIVGNTKTDIDPFELQQVNALLNNNEKYDILLFVQIPMDFFLTETIGYLKQRAEFFEKDGNPEFFYSVTQLKDEAIPYFQRFEDKSMVNQLKTLASELEDVQYIHIVY